MNLFISSSRYRHTAVPIVAGLIILAAVNISVALLPYGSSMRHFKASIQVSREIGDGAKVMLFGDSRSTRFKANFFQEKTLSFPAANTTVIYAKLLFDRIIDETNARPKIVILALGANNYNKNGIFTIRAFAVRRLASLSDIRGFVSYRGGFEYMIDALFARVFPVYGRRMEIGRPAAVKRMFRSSERPVGMADASQMVPLDPDVLHQEPERSVIDDHEYWLIYERSVYPNYELSRLHIGMLEALIDTAIKHGAIVVTVQLPIEPKMRQLEQVAVGKIFDDYLVDLRLRKHIIHLDLRDDPRFEFHDLNHLTYRGSRDLVEVVFNPLIAHHLKSEGL